MTVDEQVAAAQAELERIREKVRKQIARAENIESPINKARHQQNEIKSVLGVVLMDLEHLEKRIDAINGKGRTKT